MTVPYDLGPAADRLDALLEGVEDSRLGDPTPSTDVTVAMLLEHILGLAEAFTAAAEKRQDAGTSAPPQTPSGDLPAGWREALPAALRTVAEAWRAPEAWTGMTTAGGVTMPAEVMASVVLDELVLHGWDLAVATGQSYVPTEGDTEVVFGFTAEMCRPEHLESREGLFGPEVEVAPDAPLFARALGQSGRDPQWRRASRT